MPRTVYCQDQCDSPVLHVLPQTLHVGSAKPVNFCMLFILTGQRRAVGLVKWYIMSRNVCCIVKVNRTVQYQMSNNRYNYSVDPAKHRHHTGKIPHTVCILYWSGKGSGSSKVMYHVKECLLSRTVQYRIPDSSHIVQTLQNSVIT